MNCRDCEYNKLIPDPDPNDWFRKLDTAMICTLAPNPFREEDGYFYSDRHENRTIVRVEGSLDIEESEIPSWCPLGKKNESL